MFPIDIDHVQAEHIPKLIKKIGELLEIDISKCAQVATGNGVQIIIQMMTAITDPKVFTDLKPHYNAMCGRITKMIFEEKGLSGEADPANFTAARILRMPFTKNIKPKKGEKFATLINGHIEPIVFDLAKISGLDILKKHEYISKKALNRYPEPDTRAVLEGCSYLSYCEENQKDLIEPQWYAMMGILAYLPRGEEYAHKYSKDHPSYSPKEAQRKFDQAKTNAGPRTCANIETTWEGCADCPNYGKVNTPVLITDKKSIATKGTGFWNMKKDSNDVKVPSTPNYDDLMNYYHQKHSFKTLRESENVLLWQESHWKMAFQSDMKGFVEEVMNPKPSDKNCVEFIAKVRRNYLADEKFARETKGINLKNGVYLPATGKLEPHSKKYGFTYVLPFDYNPEAKCPRFLQFLDEISLCNKDMVKSIREMFTATICNIPNRKIEKAFILKGGGANGKSVLLATLKHLLGQDNFSVVAIDGAASNITRRHVMAYKLANITEETPRRALMESDFFKDVVSGGEVEYKNLYKDTYIAPATFKLIMATNEMPEINDTSHGLSRRLIIIPFDRTFERDQQDKTLIDTLQKEAEGILAWAIQGHREIIKNNYSIGDYDFIDREVKKTATDTYLGQWMSDNYAVTDKKRDVVTCSDLVKEYFGTFQGVRPSDRKVKRDILNYLRAILDDRDYTTLSKGGQRYYTYLTKLQESDDNARY